MAQKITGYVKLQIPAGKATPAPPVGPALGQHGINIAAFTKEFNERTKNDVGLIIPVVITVYADRSFTFITKTPPAAVLIKKACNIESGSGVPNKTKVATISGLQHRVRLRCAQQDQGGHHQQGRCAQDRRDQDARPERGQHRGGYEHDRRHCPLHGHRGGRLSRRRE